MQKNLHGPMHEYLLCREVLSREYVFHSTRLANGTDQALRATAPWNGAQHHFGLTKARLVALKRTKNITW